MEEKIRWFKVWEADPEIGFYIVGAKNHSRAKIQWCSRITGNYTDKEALLYGRAKLVKEKLSREPQEEGDTFGEGNGEEDELIEKGVCTGFVDF